MSEKPTFVFLLGELQDPAKRRRKEVTVYDWLKGVLSLGHAHLIIQISRAFPVLINVLQELL